ncbi:MAG: DUF4340 domain-containing protein [Planctomycetota bacterium]
MRLNLYLSVIFVGLLVPCFFKWQNSVRALVWDEVPRLFEGFTPENVAIIVMQRTKKSETPTAPDTQPETEGLRLVRSEEKWLIASGRFANIKARSSDIENNILSKIKKIEVTQGTVIVEDADEEKLKEFGLDEASATRVQCADATQKPIADILIGRKAGGAEFGSNATSGTFVRRFDQTAVILFDEEIAPELEDKAWIEKQIQNIEETEIKAIRIKNEKGEIAFSREEGKEWVCDKGKPTETGGLKGMEVTNLLAQARSIYCQDITDPMRTELLPQYGLGDDSRIQVELTTKDDKKHTVRIGKRVEGKQEYHACVLDGKVLFTLADWNVTPYEKDPKDFFDPPAPPEAKDPGKSGGEEAGAGKNGKETGKKGAAGEAGKAPGEAVEKDSDAPGAGTHREGAEKSGEKPTTPPAKPGKPGGKGGQ